jgi:hypothetical protein
MTELRPAVGAANSYLLTARDDVHTLYAQITLAEQNGDWLVVELTPPDFEQVFAPAGPPPPAPPSGSAGPEDATRLFLRGYLPWLYGRGATQDDHGRDQRAPGGPKRTPPARAADDGVAAAEGRGDRDAAPRPRLAGASEHQRRARDLRARAHDRANAPAMACHHGQLTAMNTLLDGLPSRPAAAIRADEHRR